MPKIKEKDLWNLDKTIAVFILPRLQAFYELKRSGHPASIKSMAVWNKILKKMIVAFELQEYWEFPDKKQKKLIEEGLNLFAKHLGSLWD